MKYTAIFVFVFILAGLGYFFSNRASSLKMQNDDKIFPIENVPQAQEVVDAAKELKEKIEDKTQAAVERAEEKIEEKKTVPAEPKTASKPEETQKSRANELSIETRLMKSGFASGRKAKVDTIVLHSSYDALGNDPYSVSGLIKEYEAYGVSAHYLIDREGIAYRLVKESDTAYHAGASKMSDGRGNVNDFSIGIEIMGTKTSGYTDEQYSSVNALIANIQSRYAIKHIVGHADIAPDRKTDPWNFDWKRLE